MEHDKPDSGKGQLSMPFKADVLHYKSTKNAIIPPFLLFLHQKSEETKDV